MKLMDSAWIKQSHDGVIITVHAVPRAAKNAVQGLHGDALKIRLHAPPVDGKANEALISFLSRKLNIPKSNIALKSGLNQRRKIVLITESVAKLPKCAQNTTPARQRLVPKLQSERLALPYITSLYSSGRANRPDKPSDSLPFLKKSFAISSTGISAQEVSRRLGIPTLPTKL